MSLSLEINHVEVLARALDQAQVQDLDSVLAWAWASVFALSAWK